jgi:hypothetical protein
VLQQSLRAAQARRTVVASAAGARGTRLFAIRGGCARCAGVDHGSPSRWNTGLAPGTERVIERSGDLAIGRSTRRHRASLPCFSLRTSCAIWRSGDRTCSAMFCSCQRIAAMRHSSYIVFDRPIDCAMLRAAGAGNSPLRHSSSFVSDRETSQSIRPALLFPGTRDSPLRHSWSFVSDRATSQWIRPALLFPGTRDSLLHHTSSFVSDRATSQSILQLCCFPVLETRPCAIRRPSSAIGRPHDSVLGIDDGAARSGQAIDPASQPFLQITRCRAVANGSDRHCFRIRSSDAS